jgi:hypothetical protein
MRCKWDLSAMGIIVIAAALFSNVWAGGLPRSSPEKVTDEDITIYQNGMERGCKDAGRRKGNDPASGERLCGCVMAFLKANLTHEQWQQMVFAGQHNDEKGQAKVMLSAGKPDCQKDPKS